MSNITFNPCIKDNQAVKDAYSMLCGNIHMETDHSTARSIVITSCEPKAGKTSIAANLAITLAGWGKKTVFVNADMRSETKHVSIPKLESNLGLSQYLSGNADYQEIKFYTNIGGLKYIPNGGVSLNPIGQICSDKFNELLEKLKSEFDYIIFDSPPLNTVSDAILVSTKVESTIIVAKIGSTNLKALNRSKEDLKRANANLLGVVINDISEKHYKTYLDSYNYFNNDNDNNEKSSKKSILALKKLACISRG